MQIVRELATKLGASFLRHHDLQSHFHEPVIEELNVYGGTWIGQGAVQCKWVVCPLVVPLMTFGVPVDSEGAAEISPAIAFRPQYDQTAPALCYALDAGEAEESPHGSKTKQS